jgi:predicted nuclease with TOPRIM domain
MSWGQRLQRLTPSTLIRHLRELETLPQLKERNRELGARVKRLTSVQKGSEQAVARLTAEVGRLETRVRQLVAAHETTEKKACDVARITVFSEPDRVLEHVRRAANEASLDMEPFPHIVVDPVLPDDAYDALVGAVPPLRFLSTCR